MGFMVWQGTCGSCVVIRLVGEVHGATTLLEASGALTVVLLGRMNGITMGDFGVPGLSSYNLLF